MSHILSDITWGLAGLAIATFFVSVVILEWRRDAWNRRLAERDFLEHALDREE